MSFQGQKGCSDGDMTLETQHDTPFLSAGLVNSKTFQFTARGLCNFSPQQRALPFVSSFVYCADVDFHFSFELSIMATGPLSSPAPCPFTLAPCVLCVSSTDLFLIFSCALLASRAAKLFQGLPSVAPCSNCLTYADSPMDWFYVVSSTVLILQVARPKLKSRRPPYQVSELTGNRAVSWNLIPGEICKTGSDYNTLPAGGYQILLCTYFRL